MNQYKNLILYGFTKGKYTYYSKDVAMWRRLTNNANGKIKMMPLIENSGSFGWYIQGTWINRNKMSDHCGVVYLQTIIPF